MQPILVGSDPERFFVPGTWDPGWVGVRLDLREPPDWDELAEMIAESYCLTAPKRLAAQVGPPADRSGPGGRRSDARANRAWPMVSL